MKKAIQGHKACPIHKNSESKSYAAWLYLKQGMY